MDSQNRAAGEGERRGAENQLSPGPGEVCYGNTLACWRTNRWEQQGSCYPAPQDPGRKTGKGYKQVTHGRAMQMTDGHVKGCLDPIGVREMKIRATMRYDCLPIRLANANKEVTRLRGWRNGYSHQLTEMRIIVLSWENNLETSIKNKKIPRLSAQHSYSWESVPRKQKW